MLLTAWSLAERGFSGGRWSDVPIIKSFADPRLYRQDPFIWTLHEGTPAAYPYQLIAALVRALPWLSLDQALFLLYFPATIAALALLYRIGTLLSGIREAALLFGLLYVAGFRLLTVGSAVLHSAELTPQTLALPFQLASVYALLVRHVALAGVLMGLAFNLHAPTTVYMAAAIGVYEILSIRRLGFKSVAVSLILVVLAGAPTIVGSLLRHGDQLPLWALNLARAELATDTSLATHFSSRPVIVYNLLGLALIKLALRSAPADAGRRAVLLFGLAVGLMCLVAWVFFDLTLRTAFSTLVARLQLPRSAWILDVFGLLYLSRYLVLGWWTTKVPRPLVLLIVAAMLAAPPDFVPLDPLLIAAELLLLACFVTSAAIVRRICWWAPWALALLGGLAGLFHLEFKELDFELGLRTAVVFMGLAAGWGIAQELTRAGRAEAAEAPASAVGEAAAWSRGTADPLPQRGTAGWLWGGALALAFGALTAVGVQRVDQWLYASAHKGGLKAAADFQEWARTQTPVDSVFLILPSEPNNNSFYENAERAVFLVRERANQAVYFSEHSFEFERRVRALGIEQPLRYREELDPAFRRLTEEHVRALSREFGVTHFVPARPGNFTFPVVYQAGGWTAYEVR
jgi:hypothetical protein